MTITTQSDLIPDCALNSLVYTSYASLTTMVPQTSYKIIFALLFGVTILETFAQTRPRFDLVPSFTEGSNEVLFRCRDKMTSSPYSSALFWLNGTNLIDQADYVRSGASGGEIEFIITRQLEGNYTCGKLSPDGLTREESIPEAYVGEVVRSSKVILKWYIDVQLCVIKGLNLLHVTL